MPGVLCQEKMHSIPYCNMRMNGIADLLDFSNSDSSSDEDSPTTSPNIRVLRDIRYRNTSSHHELPVTASVNVGVYRRGHSVPRYLSHEDSNLQQLINNRRSSLQSHSDIESSAGSQAIQTSLTLNSHSLTPLNNKDVSQPESNQEALVRRSAMDGKEKKMSSSRKSPLRTSSIQQFDVEPPIDILYSLLPSDLSDSNDSEPKSSKLSGTQNETVTCPDIASHHQGREVINTVIGLPIDDVFTLLFTNSKFMFDLHLARKTYDVVASNWQSNPDTNQKIRQVTYTVTLPTNSFGPKVSHVTETQVISAFSKPSEIYTVDAEACNGGIPYADYFSVSNHWCLTKESTNETRLNVWTEVKYKKNVWGFMKNVIDKNAFSGMKCLLKDMNDSLLQEVDKGVQKPVRRRRRRALSKCFDNIDALPILGDKVKDAHKSTQVPSRKTTLPLISATGLTATPESPVRSAALLFLCVLLGVNAFLYYRLYALEDKMVNGGRTPSVTFDPALFKSEDVTVQEWVKILHEQEALHSSEVDRWKKAVSEAADYLKKAEESLRNLHASIPHNQASKVQSLLRHLKLLQQIQQSEKPLADKLKAPDEGILPSEEL